MVFSHSVLGQNIQFDLSTLQFNGFAPPLSGTSLRFGPDGRLYMTELNGQIKIYTIKKSGQNTYTVVAAEILLDVQNIPNYDDTGTLAWDGRSNRQTLGIALSGTASNPILYVTSSDPKWGGPTTAGGDRVVDTNSGIVTQFSWTGSSWNVIDIVRGLPRSEENHSLSGLEYTIINGKPYLLVTSGGNTNAGTPGKNFAYTQEYALSGAIVSIDLEAINSISTKTDPVSGRKYKYDLPTLDDPSRPNVNGIYNPNQTGYNGIDIGDPFGGNDGLNMAMIIPGGPVQIFSGGYRNTYDLVVTKSGKVFLTDNGPNTNWGGMAEFEGDANKVTNKYVDGEPGNNSTNPSANGEYVNNEDHLTMITADISNYSFGSFYGGHSNPLRANPGNQYEKGSSFPFLPGGSGLFTRSLGDDSNWTNLTPLYTPNAIFRTQILSPVAPGQPGFDTYASTSLPANWPPLPKSMSDPKEADFRATGLPNPNGPIDDFITILKRNSNAIEEYSASNFGGQLKGALIIGRNQGFIHLVTLNPNGTLKTIEEDKWNLNGGNALGINCQGDEQIFPGTIWIATFNNKISIMTPAISTTCPAPGEPLFDPLADYDNDGFLNQDEIDNGTEYCSGASKPSDFDGDFISNLNDLDDDGDGVSDAADPFQLGISSDLPINNELFSDKTDELGRPFGYLGLGLTGLMNNGSAKPNWLNWLDVPNGGPLPDDIYGGAAGAIQIAATSGTANGTSNSQAKGFQFGINVGVETGEFIITAGLLGLQGPQLFYDIAHNGEIGIQMGDGTQSNFFKLVFTKTGIVAGLEVNNIPDPNPLFYAISTANRPNSSENIDFILKVNPILGNVTPMVRIGSRPLITLGTKTLTGKVLEGVQQKAKPLAVGFFGTSAAPGVEFLAAFDYILAKGGQPFISNPIPDVSKQAGSIPKVIDLLEFFDDDEGKSNLDFSVSTNTNTIIGTSISSNILTISFPATPNTGFITVRATDDTGLYVEQTFWVEVIPAEQVVFRINAGGNLVAGLNGAPNWKANETNGSFSGDGYSVNTGTSNTSIFAFENRHSSIPEYIDKSTFESVFGKERESTGSGNMVFSIPISSGTYKVNLYMGNSSTATNILGTRVFDVRVENTTVLSNVDLFQKFGQRIGGMEQVSTVVSDGTLNIEFVKKTGNPLINGIEIIGTKLSDPIVITNLIPDQVSSVGQVLDGNLFFAASGGVGSLIFSALNLPPGIDIEPANGRIYGIIESSALNNSPYQVSLKVRDSNSPIPNEETASFTWTVLENTLNAGLVGHWRMNEGSGNVMIDNSAYGNHAQLASTTGLTWESGKEGLAVRLPNAKNVFGEVPHNPSVNITDAITITAWIKPEDNSTKRILTKTNPDGFEFGIFNTQQIEFRINRSSSGTAYRLLSKKTYSYDGNTWTHVAVTFDGSKSTMYINGIEDNSANYTALKIKPNTSPLQIGARESIDRWLGALDEVRLYNRALSGSEILEIFSGKPKILTAPILSSPANQATNIPLIPILSWQQAPDALEYNLQVSSNSQFNNPIIDLTGIKETSISNLELQPNTTYYWRVASKNISSISDWSMPRSFITIQVLDDLIGYWKMDEGSGNSLFDSSPNFLNADIVNYLGVTWTQGKSGLALNLNGSTGRYGSVAHNPILNLTQAITISAWIKPDVKDNKQILSKGGVYELGTIDTGLLEFRLNRDANGSTYRLRSNKTYPNDGNTWMHVAATFNGTSSAIYINGVLDNSATYTPTSIKSNSTALQIGARGGINRWDGSLDEVKLYKRALSSAEIQNLLGEGPTVHPNLVGFWKMEEGNGNSLIDHSGRNNNANILNNLGVIWVPGKMGLALRLNGEPGRYGIVPHNPTINISNELTISAWTRPNGGLGNRQILSKGGPDGYELSIFEGGLFEFRINRETNGSTYRLRSKTPYPSNGNTWIHVAVTFNGTKSTIYINGAEDNSMTFAKTAIKTNLADLNIGSKNSGQNKWIGDLDEVRLYDKALSGTEIANLANASQALRTLENDSKNAISQLSAKEGLEVVLEDILDQDQVSRIYPNPVEDQLHLDLPEVNNGIVQISIYDMKGIKKLDREMEISNSSMDLEIKKLNLKPGTHVLLVNSDGKQLVFKFFKK